MSDLDSDEFLSCSICQLQVPKRILSAHDNKCMSCALAAHFQCRTDSFQDPLEEKCEFCGVGINSDSLPQDRDEFRRRKFYHKRCWRIIREEDE